MRIWSGIFLLGAALNVLIGLRGWPDVFAGHLNDPDSYMRLERIRQGVAHGHLVNMVARDDSGAGVLIEWSRLLDTLLWAMALPFAPFLGWTRALFTGGIIFGPLGAGLLSLSLAAVAEPFVARRFLWLLPICVALLPALSNYAGPGIVTHHMLLLVLVAATVALVIHAWEGEVGFAFLAGMSGGFAIWLTPETMPFVLMAFGALMLRWLERRIGVVLAACGAGFFDVLGFGLAIDPPQGGYGVAEIDRLSVVFTVLGLAVFLAGIALWQLERWKNPNRRVVGIALAAFLLAAWLALFPSVLRGPYGLMDAANMTLFFSNIEEMQGAQFNTQSFAILWPGFFALAIAAVEYFKTRNWRWAYASVCVLLMLALGIKFIRFAPISSAAAAIIATIALQRISARLMDRPALAGVSRLSIVALLIAVPGLPAWAAMHMHKQTLAAPAASCDLKDAAPALAIAKGQVVLADVNATPELLWRTDVMTVGSFYHHGLAGFLRLRAAWRSTPGSSEPETVAATGARYVLFCTGAGRSDLVADLPKDTLWDALLDNHPPVWLDLRAAIPNTGWKLFQIRP